MLLTVSILRQDTLTVTRKIRGHKETVTDY